MGNDKKNNSGIDKAGAIEHITAPDMHPGRLSDV